MIHERNYAGKICEVGRCSMSLACTARSGRALFAGNKPSIHHRLGNRNWERTCRERGEEERNAEWEEGEEKRDTESSCSNLSSLPFKEPRGGDEMNMEFPPPTLSQESFHFLFFIILHSLLSPFIANNNLLFYSYGYTPIKGSTSPFLLYGILHL